MSGERIMSMDGLLCIIIIIVSFSGRLGKLPRYLGLLWNSDG